MGDGGLNVHLEHFPGEIEEWLRVTSIIVNLEQVHGIAQTKLLGHREIQTQVGTAKVGDA